VGRRPAMRDPVASLNLVVVTRTLPLVFHEDYVCPLPEGHRFPMPKFGLLRDHLVEVGMADADGFHPPDVPPREVIERVHDPDYLNAFMAGTLDRDAVRRIGLPWSPALVQRTLTAIGGTLRTTQLAVELGLACNTAGGTHHAHRTFGSGFCILNDIAVAARFALDQGLARRVLVIDLDVHQGDGSAAIFADVPEVYTFSMHCGKNFPARKTQSDWDVALANGLGGEAYLTILNHHLPGVIDAADPDLVLYDAGVDVHVDDALGKLALTDADMRARDDMVLAATFGTGLPTACVIGGGYDPDHLRLAKRHATLHRAADAAWKARP